MSIESTPPNDLPPRTWRLWWRNLPRWFRIGFWSLLACIGLQTAIGIRIAIGLIEPAEIAVLRRPGVFIGFASDRRDEPFQGFNRLLDGLNGRSSADVVGIQFDSRGTDGDLRHVGTHFPNVEDLYLTGSNVSVEGLRHLRACRKLSHLNLCQTDIDDDAVKLLAEFDELRFLNLTSTLITDASIPALEHAANHKRLEYVDANYTDLSLTAIQAWRARARQSGRRSILHTEKDNYPNAVLASIRWADGARSGRFHGRFSVGYVRPSGRPFHTDSSSLARDRLWWSKREFATESGEFRFTLTLGNFEAEPVAVTITDGKPSTNSIVFQMPVTQAEALRK